MEKHQKTSRSRIEQRNHWITFVLSFTFSLLSWALFSSPAKSTSVFSPVLHCFNLTWPQAVPGRWWIFPTSVNLGPWGKLSLPSMNWWCHWCCSYFTVLSLMYPPNIPLYWPKSLLQTVGRVFFLLLVILYLFSLSRKRLHEILYGETKRGSQESYKQLVFITKLHRILWLEIYLVFNCFFHPV